MTIRNQQLYTDFDLSFNKKLTGRLVEIKNSITNESIVDEHGFSVKKEIFDVRQLTESYAIIRSIKNIILTMPGEKKFDFSYGTTIFKMLFELAPLYGDKMFIVAKMREKINKYEPRVNVKSIDINYDIDYNYVNLVFSLVIIKTQSDLVVPLILKRVR